MNKPKSVTSKYGLTLCIVGLLMLPAPVAFAQSSACVHLLTGAGYAAWMRVVSGDFATSWSYIFSIGQTKCKELDGIATGDSFTVQVSALFGELKHACTPSITRGSGSQSVTFQAWGTTYDIKCQMPSSENVGAIDTSTTASKEGLAAAERAKTEGATLKPPE